MPTAVVSGRIDEELKRRADVIIRSAGSSVGRVINDVWHSIAETGELPKSPSISQETRSKRLAFDSFMDWFGSLPAQNDVYAALSDDEILAMRIDDYV